jgi:spermidine synthase
MVKDNPRDQACPVKSFAACVSDAPAIRGPMMTLHEKAARDPVARGIRSLLFALFFCSGASGLIYEVVWTRQLTVILGNTVFAVSTVLTAFMGGLALGSFLGGRMIDRVESPLRVYALLEIAIGILAFCLTSALNQTGPLYLWIHGSLGEYPLALYAARYVFSFCLLAIPTTIMGTTLPVLSKFVARTQRAVGLDVGRLYALNTLGAAAGCYLAGFVLIGNLGLGATVRAASALSIAVGLLAWVCQKYAGPAAPKASSPPVQQAKIPAGASPLRLLVLGAFAVSGFAALGYEVLWTRLLTSYLGNSVYAFSTMLTAFLTGIALGSLWFSYFADRSRRAVAVLGLIEAAIGFYVLCSIHIFGWRAESLSSWIAPDPRWPATGARFMNAFTLIFFPTFLMGAAFPVAGRIYIANFRRLGRSVGELYAWNTIGAILGAAAAGFALMPVLGLENSLVVLLCLNLGIGLALCAAEPAVRRSQKTFLLAALVVAAGVGLAAMPRGVFRRMHEVLAPGEKLLYFKEDLLGTVTVKQQGRHRTLFIDHLEMAGTADRFLSSHKSLAHLPMLLHPNPQTVYVLGFGAGGTAYGMSTYPEVRRIDATELSRSVVDVAPMFLQINHDVMSDPRLHLEVNDGRHFLLTTRRTYDVISVDLLWPQTAGSGSLYTREFYELCRRRLTPDGILVEWLHPGFIPPDYLKGILRTMGRVFPHTSLWWTRREEHLLVVASKAPLRVDYQRLAQRINHPATRRDLAEVHLDDPATFLSYFIARDDALEQFAADADWLNTDDLPLLEYKLPLYTADAAPENMRAVLQLRQSVLPLLERVSPQERERILTCERSNERLDRAVLDFREGRFDRTVAQCREALLVNPDNHDARALLEGVLPALRERRPDSTRQSDR